MRDSQSAILRIPDPRTSRSQADENARKRFGIQSMRVGWRLNNVQPVSSLTPLARNTTLNPASEAMEHEPITIRNKSQPLNGSSASATRSDSAPILGHHGWKRTVGTSSRTSTFSRAPGRCSVSAADNLNHVRTWVFRYRRYMPFQQKTVAAPQKKVDYLMILTDDYATREIANLQRNGRVSIN